MRVLITGASGFVGRHLVSTFAAARSDAVLVGLVRPGTAGALADGAIETVPCDLEDAPAVLRSLERIRPDRIVHLAAQSSPHARSRTPAGTLRTNVLGLLNLLEAVRRRDLGPRMLVVGSAEEYGRRGRGDLPLREDAPLRPHSPYAVSKVAQGFLALQYALSHGLAHRAHADLPPHRARPRARRFAESSFARQIAEIEAGRARRWSTWGTWTRCATSRTCATSCAPTGCSWSAAARARSTTCAAGRGVRIGDVLDMLVAGSRGATEVRVDPSRLRPSDIPVVGRRPRRSCARPPAGSRTSRCERTPARPAATYWRDARPARAARRPAR